ncbi:MAG: ABC transporter ATP-binding protein [Clostridia bacterium]|nr:ABC transporter ATP-binding protein [Clostridia bacterium]
MPPMPGRGPGGPGGHGGRGMPVSKPKGDTKKVVARLLKYIGTYKYLLFAALSFVALSAISSTLATYILSPILDIVSGETMADATLEAKLLQISLYIVALLVIYLVNIVAQYVQAKLMLHISQNSMRRLRHDLFVKIQKLPIKFFDNESHGEIMSRFTNDVDNIATMFDSTLTSLVSGVVTLISTFCFMCYTNFLLTVITIVFIPIFILGGQAITKRSRKYHSAQQAALGAVNGYVEESVSGQKVVKVFNHEDTCVDEFAMLNDDLREKQIKAQFFGGIMGPVMGNTGQISYALTAGVGGILCILKKLTLGNLAIFVTYSRHFSRPINEISMQMNTVFSALAGAERVFDVLDRPEEEPDVENANAMPEMKGYVKLNDVTFGYVPGKTILKNISLYAKPGQKIAFVGSTGAGKTTITNLLNRFYDIDSGEITIDDVNIRDIKRDVLRKNIAMVLQDTHLFTGTIMENIRYGRPDATDDEVIAAAKTASAHSFIMRLENGYDTVITGDGANLSQGQRQLLNIARAAISHAPILVLDEATSSVDTRTERHIEHGMDRLMKNRTTFVIAHRLSTVRNANAIMVLENGEIIERGTHDELLAMKGRYYELYTGKKELD